MDGVDLLSVSRVHGIEYGTLRYWASRDGWQRVGRYKRRTLYDYDTVTGAVEAWQKRSAQQMAA